VLKSLRKIDNENVTDIEKAEAESSTEETTIKFENDALSVLEAKAGYKAESKYSSESKTTDATANSKVYQLSAKKELNKNSNILAAIRFLISDLDDSEILQVKEWCDSRLQI